MLEVAVGAARLAASICERVQLEDNRPDVGDKAQREPVTIADYASQAVILRALSQAFPSHRILSEEDSSHLRASMDDHVVDRITQLCAAACEISLTFDDVCRHIDWSGGDDPDYCWAIDPIDGTKGFLRGDQYAVAIGLLYRNVPVLGALACPNLELDPKIPDAGRGVLMLSSQGNGAWQEPLRGGGRSAIRVSETTDPGEVRILGSVESSHGDPKVITALVEDLKLGEMVRVDSQAKYGLLARGGAEVYLRPRSRPDYRDNVWDHVAGCAIATEAGARCTDQDGAPLDFSFGRKLESNRGVLATHGALHDDIVASLRRISALA